jgi:8-oxo-dGTP pyrophosphatase MutT (NUDIX family)
VAAYLYAGETYGDAAQRRLYEELGLELPLAYATKIGMHDEDSLKFVELYLAQSDAAEIREQTTSPALSFGRGTT